MATRGGRGSTLSTGTSAHSPGVMLGLATVGFLVNFWAWALISPLGVAYREQLGLTAFQQALLVAVPVIVGSVGRIPVGALTDRLGARVMFPAVSFLTIMPVLFVGLFGRHVPAAADRRVLPRLGRTAFAVGVPLVNAWYPPARRGLALGIFGDGHGRHGRLGLHDGAAGHPFGRAFRSCWSRWCSRSTARSRRCCCATPPGAPCPPGSFLRPDLGDVADAATLQLSALYAVGFGGFVAFSVYLPTYLEERLWAHPGRRRTAHRRVRRARRGDAPDRRLVVRPVPPRPGAPGCFADRRGTRRARRRAVPLIPWAR